MKKQQGAALVLVLILLAVSLMLGLFGVQSSLMDERMAGNYRAAVQAQMNAEHAVSEFYEAILGGKYYAIDANVEDAVLKDGFGWADFREIASSYSESCKESREKIACFLDIRNNQQNKKSGKYIVGMGSVAVDEGRLIAVSRPVFAMLSKGRGSGRGIVGCEGISLSGGPQIDSFNSSYGGYGEKVKKDGESFNNSLRQGAVVKTFAIQASLELSGNSPIYGDVVVPGEITLNSGTPIYGNVYSDSDIKMNGRIYGDLATQGSVSFGSASSMQGSVVSGGDVIIGGTANPPLSVSANGSITYPEWWQWDQSKRSFIDNYESYQDNSIPSRYVSEKCDNANVFNDYGEPGGIFDAVWENPLTLRAADYFDMKECGHCYSSQGRGFVFTGGKGNQDASTTVLGAPREATYLRIDEDVITGGRLSKLVIEGNVTLAVDGDFSLGNNTQLLIMEGATLDLLVTGRTMLGGGASISSSKEFVRKVEIEGETIERAAVSLFSAYRGYGGSPSSAGVTISGANSSFISAIAPATDVIIAGSGSVFGDIRAGKIDMRGSGDIHFDEALRNIDEANDASEYELISWN